MDEYVICKKDELVAIADAIRSKTGGGSALSLSEMSSAVTNDIKGVEEPYVKYLTDDDGKIIEAKIYGFTTCPSFYEMSDLRSVDFSGSPNLTTIPNRCFQNCTSLTLTSLPSGITSIGDYAFQNCTSLTLTSLPSGITSIGGYAFYDCTSLALTSLPSGITSIGSFAFNRCTSLALTSLPSGITTIKSNTFYECTSLALTSLPSSITSISQVAFYGCTRLAIDKLPSAITSIGTHAFYGCTSLVNMEIAATKLGAGSKIFYGCTGLKNIWIRSTCTSITASSAANSHFNGCSTSLKIYAEPTAKQAGWHTYFNRTGSSGGTTVTVTYGQTTCPW